MKKKPKKIEMKSCILLSENEAYLIGNDLCEQCNVYRKKICNKWESYHNKVVAELEAKVSWYIDRFNKLQEVQTRFRDPERKVVCDILANGTTKELQAQKVGVEEIGELIAVNNHHDCNCSYKDGKLIPCKRCSQIEIQAQAIHDKIYKENIQ
jgi:hypothetical protein